MNFFGYAPPEDNIELFVNGLHTERGENITKGRCDEL